MTRVYLVRHAMPVVDAGVPPWRWRLGEAGRAAAAALADRVPGGAVVVSSPEPKAVQTAAALTSLPVRRDAGLGEVARPAGFDPRHRDIAASYLAGAGHPGWEARAAVVARFDAAVHRHRDGGRDLVVVTHGMALSLWVQHTGAVGDTVAWWRALAFPDVATVELD